MDRDFNGARNIFLKNMKVLRIAVIPADVFNFGAYPLSSQEDCTETVMSPLDSEFFEDFEIFNYRSLE